MNKSKDRIPLQISNGIIIAPIRYEITDTILHNLKADLLPFVEEHDADAVVFDLKGIELVDVEDFEGLISIISMIRIMGLETILCGLSPGVVAAMVALDVDTKGVETALDLSGAFAKLSKEEE